MKQIIMFSLTFFGSITAFSQSNEPVNLTNDEAIAFIKGKTHSSSRTAGGNPRLEFQEDGTMYGSNGGSSDSGKWRIENGKLCMAWEPDSAASR